MSVTVGEYRLVVTCMGAFILSTAIVAQEPLAHDIFTQMVGTLFMAASIATLIEAGGPKNDE